jgi:hypothetical protein
VCFVARTVHNCSQTALDVLPMHIEVLVVKIWRYLHKYAVPLTQFKSVCGFVTIEHKKLFHYGKADILPSFFHRKVS